MNQPEITTKIDRLVAITKNKTINIILMVFFILSIFTIAYTDLNFPKDISKMVAYPIFIVMGLIMAFYIYVFISIRVLTSKEEIKYFRKNFSKDSKLPKDRNHK